MRRLFARASSSRPRDIPAPGDLVAGKYRIHRVIGQGGMGVVFAAQHEQLHRPVAVKVLTVRDTKGISRFLREARSTACMSGLHVVHVLDFGTLRSGAPFIAMEYLEGCDLKQLIETRVQLPIEEAVGYVVQACEGLAQAHVAGIVHRDLKPANLFLTVLADGSPVIKIVDFGISKPLGGLANEKAGTLTEEHSTLGSPAYMAPEQIRAAKGADTRSDIWSLGVVLFELLTGTTPFATKSLGELFAAVLESDAPTLASVLPGAPPGLSDALARCMRRDRDQRFQNVLDLARAIAPFGPEDAPSRVASIEQVLRNGKPRAAPMVFGDEPSTSVALPPAELPARALITGREVFPSDAPRLAGERGALTALSSRKRYGRLARFGGAAAAAALVAVVALVRTSFVGAAPRASAGGPDPSLVAAAEDGQRVSASSPAEVAPAPFEPGPAPAVPPLIIPPRPVTPPASARSTNPPAYGAAGPRRSTPVPRKHLKVLDSPD